MKLKLSRYTLTASTDCYIDGMFSFRLHSASRRNLVECSMKIEYINNFEITKTNIMIFGTKDFRKVILKNILNINNFINGNRKKITKDCIKSTNKVIIDYKDRLISNIEDKQLYIRTMNDAIKADIQYLYTYNTHKIKLQKMVNE